MSRRRERQKATAITPEVVAAFKARDWHRLHKALHLHYAHYSPLTRKESPGYGHPAKRPPPGERVILGTWDAAVELRRQILAAIAETSGTT